MFLQSFESIEHSKDSDNTGTFFHVMSNLWYKKENFIFQHFTRWQGTYICLSGSFPSANTLTFLYSSLMIAQCFCMYVIANISSWLNFISPFCRLWMPSALIKVESNFAGSFSIFVIKDPSALWAMLADVIDEKRFFLIPAGVVKVMLSTE